MASLLPTLLEALLAIPPADWPQTALIFPSRRAGVAFRKLLAQQLQQPVFAPAIHTLPDWLSVETGWRQAEALELQFALYEAYLELVPDEPLESFLHWAPEVLADFSEVDAYLLDADRVFGYLSQEKAIDLWSPESGQLGQAATQYLDFYRRLGSLYHRLREKQLEKGAVWQSMMARFLAEQLAKQTHHPHYKHYLFAGFNALNPAEEQIFTQCIEQWGARAWFEADAYYLQDEHEAGLFLRPYLEHPVLQRDLLVNGHLAAGASKISVVEALGWSAQLQHASAQISQWLAAGVPAEDCVVVLADEQMLVPLLSALPPDLPACNVTLGYPFTESHAYSWLLVWLDVLDQLPQHSWHLRQVLPILRHPLLRGKKQVQAVEKQLLASGQMWLDVTTINGIFKKLIDHWDENWLHSGATPSLWLSAWEQLFRALISEDDHLQHAMGLQAITLLRRLAVHLSHFHELNHWALFKQLLQQTAKREQVAFLGEPLAGLQVMGLLETRALAFSHVVVVGLNEGKLPLSSRQDGFITYSLRREFGLPGPREKEAVFAYHFYRLLQHAHETLLLCSNQVDDMGKGEPSRYIAQLELEWPGVALGRFSRKQLVPQQNQGNGTSIDIRFRKEVGLLEQLEQNIQKRISPSALQDLISCELKFYFKRILGLQPVANLTDALEVNELGSLLHGALEQLYAPYVGEVLNASLLARMQQEAPVVLRNWVSQHFADRDFTQGLNVLLLSVCDDYLQRFFDAEIASLAQGDLVVVAQETRWEAILSLPNRTLTLSGIVDRVDRYAGCTRIIDYKTGNFDQKEISLQAPEDLLLPAKAKALQLLAYVWLYKHQPDSPNDWPEAGILSFRKLNDGFSSLQLHGLDMTQALGWFEEAVTLLVEQLLDPNREISQTDDLKQCAKCDFRAICNR